MRDSLCFCKVVIAALPVVSCTHVESKSFNSREEISQAPLFSSDLSIVDTHKPPDSRNILTHAVLFAYNYARI